MKLFKETEIDNWYEYASDTYPDINIFVYSEVNPDGLAVFALHRTTPMQTVEVVHSGDIDLRRINGGEWADTVQELSPNTIDAVSINQLKEATAWALRSGIKESIAVLLFANDEREVTTKTVVLKPSAFAPVLEQMTELADEIQGEAGRKANEAI